MKVRFGHHEHRLHGEELQQRIAELESELGMSLDGVEVVHHEDTAGKRVVASWYDAADGQIHVQYG